jgi:hypothetical protein
MLTCKNVTVGPKRLMTSSFTWGDQFLGRAKTIRVVPCRDVSVGPKEVTTRSCTASWSVPWAGQDKPYVAMRRYLGWPKGSDNAIQHMRCYESSRCAKMTRLSQRNSLGGPKQVVCCHAKMSRLARRNSLDGPRQFIRR